MEEAFTSERRKEAIGAIEISDELKMNHTLGLPNGFG